MTTDSFLFSEQRWLRECIKSRIAISKNELPAGTAIFTLHLPPALDESEYALLIRKFDFNNEERLLLALAICNHIDPRILNILTETPQLYLKARILKTENQLSLLPTAETFFFLVAGENYTDYLRLHGYFNTDHPFYKESILDLADTPAGVSRFDGALTITGTYRDLLLYGTYQPPRFSSEFPAHLLETKLSWNDLVLMPKTQQLLTEVKTRLFNSAEVRDWKTSKGRLGDHMRPGIRIMLYGSSGQGKTLTATLLGKELGKRVYRIDLSAIVSKYIGETSKNLRNLFDAAERKNWILFIDEGDALLGTRSDLSQDQNSSNAQNANQNTSYILQRMESFDGIIIVATNLVLNIDEAFERRFEGRILFQPLSADLQFAVWNNAWPIGLELPPGINLAALLSDNNLSPAAIVNVIQRISIQMAEEKSRQVSVEFLRKCIMDEAYKYKGRGQKGS